MTTDLEHDALGPARAISQDLSDRTAQLRRLAAKADYALTGVVCTEDTFPYDIDALRKRLQKAADRRTRYIAMHLDKQATENPPAKGAP